MQWTLRLEKRAKKQLDNLPAPFQGKILAILPLIAVNPFVGKKLDGQLTGLYSFRVWPYRIIYKIEKNILLIVIISIGHRQGVY